MWNTRKYSVMAIVGAGLAFAAASPASACGLGYGGAYGLAGGYGGYGGYGGCGSYGYAAPVAVMSYGYAPVGYAYGSGCGSYGYAPTSYGCGGSYGYAPTSYGCGGSYGYAPTYGYAPIGTYGSAYGYGGCGRHHRARAAYGAAVVAFHNPVNVYAAHRSTRVFAYSHPAPRHFAVKHVNTMLARAN
jgi:hypothetical protein